MAKHFSSEDKGPWWSRRRASAPDEIVQETLFDGGDEAEPFEEPIEPPVERPIERPIEQPVETPIEDPIAWEDPEPEPIPPAGKWPGKGRRNPGADIEGPIPVTEVKNLKKRTLKYKIWRVARAFLMLVFLLALIGGIGYMVVGTLPTGTKTPTGDPVTVHINRGSTAGEIALELREKGVIRSVTAFKVAAEYYGVSESLQAGEFHLRTGMKLEEIVEALGKGPDVPSVRVTFPEGLTLRDLADRVDEESLGGRLLMAPEQFLAATQSAAPYRQKYSFLPPAPGATLEGYLFPDTYEVLQNVPPDKLIEIMLARHGQVAGELNWTKPPMGLRRDQLMVVASMIEKEAKVDKERPIIAAVIYNRLRKGMPLQIDATVQYALPQRQSRLSYEDLTIESPYNTYKNKGLPPGPIANPGKASMQAALAPAKVDYLYYVLKDDAGNHTFTKTYSEFLKAKRKRLGR